MHIYMYVLYICGEPFGTNNNLDPAQRRNVLFQYNLLKETRD